MKQLLKVQEKEVRRTMKPFSSFQKKTTINLQFVSFFDTNDPHKIYKKSEQVIAVLILGHSTILDAPFTVHL